MFQEQFRADSIIVLFIAVAFAKKESLFTVGCLVRIILPSTELTYPTLGKGKSSSKVPWQGMLVPWAVI